MFSLFDHIPAACPLCEGRVMGPRLCEDCLRDLDRLEGRLHRPGGPKREGSVLEGDDGVPKRRIDRDKRYKDRQERADATPARPAGSRKDTQARSLRCGRCGLPRLSPDGPCWPCLREPPPFSQVHVAMPYRPPYENLMARLKHRRQLWVATVLARLIAHAFQHGVADAGEHPSVHLPRRPRLWLPDLLVPIPASQASLTRRGFNPAGEIARALGRRLRVPVAPTLLIRNRDGPKQSELGRQARLIESVDLFSARRPLQGWHIGLVDDVMTTGGTLIAATEALLDRGCSQVSVFVAARTTR